MYSGAVSMLVAERCTDKCSVTSDIGLERCRISVGGCCQVLDFSRASPSTHYNNDKNGEEGTQHNGGTVLTVVRARENWAFIIPS